MKFLKATLVFSLLVAMNLVFPGVTVHAVSSFNESRLHDRRLTKNIFFSGYEWEVKSGRYAPGNNHWLGNNVWVDKDGFLHLKITRTGSRWYCAEVTSVKSFGYGSYQFQVIAPVDKLDPNIVLGLFVYPGPENSDTGSELDIEFSKWGEPGGPAGTYTVTSSQETYHFPCSLDGIYTAHQFDWTDNQILFQSFHGHVLNENTVFNSWLYNSAEYMGKIATPPVRVHMNLWLFLGQAPLDGKEQEIIIKKFIFEPIKK